MYFKHMARHYQITLCGRSQNKNQLTSKLKRGNGDGLATLRKPAGAIEKAVLDWNPQGARRRGLPRKTWRTIEEEITETGNTWREVKANQRKR
jgi:hypothetical protein